MEQNEGTSTATDPREFARIDVELRLSVQPIDPAEADRWIAETLESPSVWAPTDETTLRSMATSGLASPETTLAQAVLELSTQVVKLRSRLRQPGGRIKHATLRQLSGGGGRMTCELALGSDDLFELCFDDDDHDVPPVHAVARVVHVAAPEEGYGFRYEAIHPRDRDLLIRMIYKLQRRALRRAHSED